MTKKEDFYSDIVGNKEGEPFVHYLSTNVHVKRAVEHLRPAYEELLNYRLKIDLKEKARYNGYDYDLSQGTDTKRKAILRSPFIDTATETFSSGMSFPDFRIDARSRKSVEIKNKEALAKALTEWAIRSSGFEDIYHKSKQKWIPYGDSYRRPFHKKKLSRTKRGNKKLRNLIAKPGEKKILQYEELDPRKILLDISVKNIRSESDSESINFWAYTDLYSEEAMVRKFGRWVLDYAKPGAMIDSEGLANRIGKSEEKPMKYYEVIEYQNRSDEVDMLLVGANGFPVVMQIEDCDDYAPKDLEEFVVWNGVYPHYDSFGYADITLQSSFMFYDSRSIRNLGLADKLYGPQIAHEIVENSKLDSTRKRMREIAVISGGRANTIESKLKDYEQKSASNIFSILHLPSNVQNIVPQTSVIRFEGVSAEDGQRSTDDVQNFARNAAGVSMTRLEVQQGIGVGQSEILEDEKIISVERIVKNNMENLRMEFTGLLNYVINMKGLDLDETITYTHHEEMQGMTRTISYKMEGREISIKEAAKQLEEFEFDLFIDKNSIIEKRQVAMAEKIINFLGVIDPAALPEVSKALMGRLADVMRVDIPADAFENIQQSQAMGGRSQFQSQTDQNEQPADPSQQALQLPGPQTGMLGDPGQAPQQQPAYSPGATQ
jgi:hypothetical protein